MKVETVIDKLRRIDCTHADAKHAADWLEAQAEVVDAERGLRVLGDYHPRADAINRLRHALARLAELEKAK